MARLVVGTSANQTTPAIVTGHQPVISSLNVTPTTSAQTITAPSGTDGYSPVNVSAVTSSIDANITAGNIKNGVTILGVTGNYAGITPSGTLNISANGTYDVTNYASASVQVSGGSSTQYGVNLKGWCGDIDTGTGGIRTDQAVGTLDMSGVTNISRSLYRKFIGSTGLVGAVDLGDVIMIESSALESTFAATSITSIDLSSVTYIDYMGMAWAFEGTTTLQSVNLSSLVSVDGYALQCAFKGSGITTLTIPVSYFSSDAPFILMCQNCPNLRSVYFPNILAADVGAYSDPDGGWMVQNVIGQVFENMIQGCSNCVVHFRSDFGTDMVQWCADNESDPEFTAAADVATFMLNAITNNTPGANSVVFDINPS